MMAFITMLRPEERLADLRLHPEDLW